MLYEIKDDKLIIDLKSVDKPGKVVDIAKTKGWEWLDCIGINFHIVKYTPPLNNAQEKRSRHR